MPHCKRKTNDETHLSTLSRETAPNAWLSETDGHGQRAQGPFRSPSQGAATIGRLNRQGMDMPGLPAPLEKRPDTTGGGCGLRRRHRLTHARDFEETFQQGQRFVGRYMILWTRAAPDASLRLGVVSSRRIGGAVTRNRARRRLREVFRLHRGMLTGKTDVVLVARSGCGMAPWEDLIEDFLRLSRRAGLNKKLEGESAGRP